MPLSYMPSYPAMEKQAHERIEVQPITEHPDIEKPIFPISEIGQTFPENDPTGRFKNVVQTAQAAIRTGAGTLQLIMMTPPESALGGRFKAYGAEVREALREVAKASEVKIRGIEMPTSMNNLSGWDMQRHRFSEEVRKRYMDEIRDGIRFAAEVTNGGGIDMVSWEFQRSINDANWNKPKEITLATGKKVKTKLFYAPGEVEVVQVVDTDRGDISVIRSGEELYLPRDPKNPKKPTEFNPDGTIKMHKWTWKDFVELSKTETDPDTMTPENPKGKAYGEENVEKLFYTEQANATLKSYEGQEFTYLRYLDEHRKRKAQAEGLLRQNGLSEKDIINHPDVLAEQKEIEHWTRAAEGNAQQAKQLKEQIKRTKPVKEYALQRSINSYAEAGVWAHQESVVNGNHLPNPIHIGPEIGWPQFYGSHPKEWAGLILQAREKMKELLTTEYRTDWDGKTLLDINGKPIVDEEGQKITKEDWNRLPNETKALAENPYFVPGMSKEDAGEEARKHIKGMFDTSHVGMFLQHFRPDLPWEQRVKEFEKWYLEQIDELAQINKKHDIIGGIQAVDTQTGAHAHLPPGQGILPIVKAVRKLKEQGGLKGYIVSEGHEEEKFGEGRILLKTWEQFGAHVNRDYFPVGGPPPLQWNRGFSNNYFGRTYSPMFIFGAYAPSNEFKLWSEIPLE